MAKFTGIYEVDDGYCGGSRPKRFQIYSGDFDPDCDEEDLKSLFETEMIAAFEQDIAPYEKNLSEFVEWAKGLKDED